MSKKAKWEKKDGDWCFAKPASYWQKWWDKRLHKQQLHIRKQMKKKENKQSYFIKAEKTIQLGVFDWNRKIGGMYLKQMQIQCTHSFSNFMSVCFVQKYITPPTTTLHPFPFANYITLCKLCFVDFVVLVSLK